MEVHGSKWKYTKEVKWSIIISTVLEEVHGSKTVFLLLPLYFLLLPFSKRSFSSATRARHALATDV